MAGLITDLSTTGALKVVYPPKAVETFIQEDLVFRPRLKRSLPPGAKLGDGYEIHFGARLNPAQNVAQIKDGGEFPTAKDSTDIQFIFKPTVFAGSYQIGLMTRYVASSNVGSFNGGEMRRRPEEVMSNLGKLIESQYVGTTGNGVRAYVDSITSAQFVARMTGAAPYGTRLINENNLFTVLQSVGGAVRDTCDAKTITAIDHDTRTVSYNANLSLVAGDPIYIVPTSGLSFTETAGVSFYANGLRGQVDDATNQTYLHTLSRATYPKLKSLRSSNGGERRNISESLLLGVAHDCARRGQKRPSTLIMGEGQCEKYVEHIAPQRRFPATGRQRAGKATGYVLEELSFVSPFGSMDFMLSFDCLPGEIYGVSWDAFFFYSALDAQWLSGHDLQNLIMMPGTNAHKALWGAYCASIENWGTDYPPGHFVVADLKDRLLGD